MITFYLVRHASYTEKYHLLPGRLPVELSKAGIDEANKLHKYFQDKNIEKIYSSAVLRCKQTAEIISEGIIPITFDQRLLELFSAYQGYWSPDAWDEYLGHQDELGGETREDVTNRVWDFLDNTNFVENKNYIICSHGDPLYQIYQKIAHVPPLSNVILGKEIVDPPDYQARGSIRIITKDKGIYKVDKTLTQKDLPEK